MKLIKSIFVAFVCVVIGVAVGIIVGWPPEPEVVTVVEYIVDDSAAIKRLKISETLTENMEKEQKLIVLETELSNNVTLDESFTSWDIFKKMQMVTVKATGRFTIDLASVMEGDIVYDDFINQVTIKLPRPEVDSITIDEEETIFHSVERGLLRFGEIRLTTAEQNEIYKKAKESMLPDLKLEVMDIAEAAAKESVTNLARKFLNVAGVENCAIDIVWK